MARSTKWYRKVYHKDKYFCAYCGKEMLRSLEYWLSLEVDHIIPQSKGGTDNSVNLVTSCNVCNKFKSSYYSKELNATMADLTNNKSRNIILKDIKNHIQKKRSLYKNRWIDAQKDYDNGIIRDVDDRGRKHY